MPIDLGQKPMASSMPVALANDQPAVTITQIAPATYSAAVRALAPALTPTDVLVITGSATKTIKVRHIFIDGNATTAGTVEVLVIKRSADDTGGTSATVAATPYDSANAAATAVVRSYSANPATLGGAVGTPIRNPKLFLALAGTADTALIDMPFGDEGQQPTTLRGVAQVLALNLNGVTVPAGGTLNITIEWTEE